MSDIGERLKLLRRFFNNESQQDFSLRTGLHRSYIGDVEAGRREPSFAFIQKLIDSTRVSPTWIMTGQEPMFISPADGVELPGDEEAAEAVRILLDDGMLQKIVLMVHEMSGDEQRSVFAHIEEKKQLTDMKKQLEELLKKQAG